MRTAWITGASSGIGRQMALRLAQDGMHVVASARTAEALATLEQQGNGRIAAWPVDVVDRDQVARAVAGIERAHGRIDLAILNAGTHRPMSADDFSTETLGSLIDVNLMGVANCLEALLPRMRARRSGHIAVVASLAGYRGLPTAAAYGASKAAVINLCEALKPDCDRAGIKLQLVDPGFIDTPLTRRNEFKMPFLMPVESACEAFICGLRSNRFEIVFPRGFAAIMKTMRILPYRLYFAVVRKQTGK